MDPVWQNPIQRTVTTAHMCLRIIVHNCRTQHSTQQFWLSSLLTPRQASQLRYCLLEGRGSFVSYAWRYAVITWEQTRQARIQSFRSRASCAAFQDTRSYSWTDSHTHTFYTVFHRMGDKKLAVGYICHHNSRKCWWILITSTYLERNVNRCPSKVSYLLTYYICDVSMMSLSRKRE